MSNRELLKKMTGVAIFSAIAVALQLFSNYVTFGPVSITLALIPIVLAAIIYGPLGGGFVGLVCGFIVIFAPSTLASFMPFNPFATIVLCLLKMGLAGYASGWIYRLINKKNFVLAVICASISVPLINTGIFTLGAMAFFLPLIEQWCGDASPYAYLFLTIIGINFIIEFLVNSILSPTIIFIVKTYKKMHQ